MSIYVADKYCVENDCYKENKKLDSVSYLIVHSPGVYPAVIRAVNGSNNWFKRWNKTGVEKLTHGFIDDTGIYNFAPKTMRCWHVGTNWGNSNCIGYELCELESEAEFNKMWDNATSYYAELCKTYKLGVDKILGHYEANAKGIASNHGDPRTHFKRFGKTMDNFRNDVSLKMKGEGKVPDIKYAAYCQTLGMQPTVSNGATAGTTGKAIRMEGLVIDSDVAVEYSGHLQSEGWTDWVDNGHYIGTMLIAKRMEAVKIRLKDSSKYSITYRVHIQSQGWSEWKRDGELAGTEGQAKRLEAVQIKIVNK